MHAGPKKRRDAGTGKLGVRATARPEPNLGEVVRRLRTERNLSVRTLAGRCAFSPSFISQIELNQASPSIASLERLAAALEVTPGDFFRGPGVSADVPGVTRAAARQQLTSWWSRARIEALSPMGPGRPFEAVMIAIAAGGSSGKRPHAHTGEELAIVFEGELRLTLADTVHMLGRGDAATFASTTPHLWENRGKRPAHLLIVSSRFTH